MLSCKDFLTWLNDYLDETVDADIRRHVETHITSCPNCWVIFDTTKKTIQVYKGMDPKPLPEDVHSRLMSVIQKKCAASKPGVDRDVPGSPLAPGPDPSER